RVYARLDRRGRGRPDASANRALVLAARDSISHRDSSRRCERGRRGMAGRPADLILIGSGSELSLVVDAKAKLEEKGKSVRVVSMPSENIFEKQDQAYRDSVLPPSIRRRLAVEAGAPMSWYRWVGLDGDIIGMTTYGASGKYEEVMKHFGFSVDNVVERALKLLAR